MVSKLLIGGLLGGLGVLVGFAASSRSADRAQPQLAHMVFFTLKDHSQEARERLMEDCRALLSGIEGIDHISVGVMAEDVDEPPVSVKDFDVALHVIFESKDAKAKYLSHPRHDELVARHKDSFAKVRVFDSYLKR